MQKLTKSFLFLMLFASSNLFANEGALLFGGNCVTCHHETRAISAPSMREVQKQYRAVFGDKKDFVKYLSAFILKPKAENSIMLEKVEKYKLMPLLGYERSVAEEIASYIYDAEF